MGDGGVACVASLHVMASLRVMEHFSKSESFCGNNTINNIHGFDIKSNSSKFSEQELQETNRNISNSQSVKEGSSAEELSEARDTSASVIATTCTNAVEHVDRPKKSSRWDVVEDNAGNSRIDDNELGVGLGLYKHGGGDEGHVSGSVQEDESGMAAFKNAAKEHLVSQSDRLDARGGSKSRRILDEVHSRSGHFESALPRISVDRHSTHHKSSRTYYGSYSRHSELSSSRSHDRFSRRSGSVDRGYPERSSHDRRWSHEERNGFRKSGGEKCHSRHTSHSSHTREDRRYHRDVGWRENRRHSNYRQSQTGRSDHLSEDCKGRVTSHSGGGHSRSSFSSITKESRSKDVEAQPGISPSQTLPSEPSERFSNELQKDSNSAHFSEQNALPEEICNFEEPRCRGWFYLDHLGFEQGPSKLGDLKRLVEEGLLQSDHLIKREGTNEWVTVEHAASPMPFGNLSLPTSKGFLQSQIREFDETSMNKPGVAANSCRNVRGMEKRDRTVFVQRDDFNNDRLEDFHIEERVEKLMQGFRLIPGRENEIVSEALCHAARHVNCDREHRAEWEGSPGLRDGYGEYCNHWRDAELGRGFMNACNVSKMATTSGVTMDKEFDYGKDVSTTMGTFLGNEVSSQTCGRWPSKGGDWKRIGEVENFPRAQNVVVCDSRPLRKKVVLNDGLLLCDIWKSGQLDPRREAPSYAAQLRRLELPAWAYRWQEERSDPLHRMDNSLDVHMQAGQASSATPKAHASTPKSQVSTPIAQVSTPRGSAVTICGYDGLKTAKPNNGDLSKSIIGNKPNSQMSAAAKGSNVCKAALPSQFEMKSVLKNNSTVLKESGPSAWELCTNSHYTGHAIVKFEQVADKPLHQHEIGNTYEHLVEEINVSPSKVHKPGMPPMPGAEAAKSNQGISSVHVRTVNDLKLHMGEWYYRDGAGHEKGPLTFTELQMLVSEGILHQGSSVYRKTDNTWVPVSHDIFATLHSKEILPVDTSFQPPGTANPVCRISEQSKHEDSSTSQSDNCFHTLYPQFVAYARGKLHEHVMKFYKSRDFSAAIGEGLDTWMAPKQSKNSMDTRISSLLLAPLTSTADNAVMSKHVDKPVDLQTSEVKLGEIPSNTITGQPGISHIISRSGLSISDSGPTSSGDPSEETHCKVKSLKQINDKVYGTSKSSRTLDIHMSDDSAGRDIFMPPPHDTDQGEPMDVDDFQVESKATVSAIHQRTHYPKRIKISSSGRSAKCHVEDGSLRGEASTKSSAGYHGGLDKIIEKHLTTTLKEIMGVNTKNFFLHEAADIEDKIKGGSYSGDIRAGLKSFQDDVFLFCRKAFQEHKRDSPAHLAAEEIFKTAHRYISSLEKKFEKLTSVDTHRQKSAHAKEILRPGKDKSQGALYSSSLNLKKRLTRTIGSRTNRTKRRRGMSYSDCSVSIEGDVSDRESRRISKNKKRCWSDSETETSESSGFLEEEFQEKEDDNNDMDDSDLDMKFGVEGEDGYFGEQKYAMEGDGLRPDTQSGVREWGARMTSASLVPPVTRKYEVIEEYVVVADEDEVSRKMRVCLPKDYEKKLAAAKDRREIDPAHLEIPELKEYRPRKRLGDEVLEQEVYGIDPYTHNLLLDTMPKGSDFSLQEQHAIIEEVLLRALNEKVRDFTGTGNTPMEYPLQNVVERMIEDAEKACDSRMRTCFQGLLKALQSRQPADKYVAYRKGLGVVCNKECGFEKDDFVVEFLGEVYPAWRWFEKQDGIRSLQKNSKDPAPEFYNIFLERPKGDGAGYDLVVVDAMHKANYASRICHSCRPNCEAKVTSVDGQYQIGIYTLRPIQYGEEITFDYNSLTESKDEYEVSVCLCGSHGCRGSYFNLAVAGAFQKVLKEFHGLLHRHQLLLEACTANSVTEEDISDLRSAGLGTCLLSGLPNWAVAFSARVVRFINFERSRLPEQILKHAIKEKKKAGVEILLEYEKSDAEIQAEGVYNQRLQSLAITLDKVRYIIRKLHQDPTKAPPPLRKLKAAELVSLLWKGEQSLVEELLRCMGPYVDAERLNRLKQQIHAHDPSGSKNVEKGLRESLLWLRDELRGIPSSCRSRHDAAADLIHLYAHTKYFFTRLDYGPLESPPLYISPLDLGPKYADSLGSGFQEWKKIYSKDYALGQLMYWYVQTSPDPGYSLTKARRGCLVLPDISSCYAKTPKQEFSRGYGSKEHAEMIRRMERQPQKQWPKGEFWEFKSNRGLFGSPMFDAVMNNSPLDKELMQWLKNRHVVFDGPWDH